MIPIKSQNGSNSGPKPLGGNLSGPADRPPSPSPPRAGAAPALGRSERTRRNILAAAERVFAQKGLSGARVDEIAAEAGANKRMLYEYYGSKEELYKTVLENVYGRLGACETFLTAHTGELDVVEAIRSIIPAYFSFLKANQSYVRMVMWENINEARYFDERELYGVRDPMKRAMREILRRGKEEGRFRQDIDETQLLLTIFACCFNYFSNIYTLTRVLSADLMAEEQIQKRVDSITEMILTYILAEPKAGQEQGKDRLQKKER